MNCTNENPPADDQGTSDAIGANEASTSLAESADRIDATAYVSGVYVAVIQIRHDGPTPRYRRRVVFNLPAANRAVDRAHMAGLEASIVLCQLVPVDGGGDRG